MTERRGKLLRALATGLGATGLGLLLAAWSPAGRLFENVEARLGDLRARALPPRPAAADTLLLIVDIDRRSVDKLGRFHSWPRTLLADLVLRLQAEGARAVVLDLLLDEGPDPAADSLLLVAMRSSGRVVAGAAFSAADSATFLYAMPQAAPELPSPALTLQGDPATWWPQERLEPLLPGLAGAARWGFVNARPDEDGVVRRAPLLASFAGQVWPSLALAALPLALDWRGLAVEGDPARLILRDTGGPGRRTLRLDGRGNLLLNYRGPWQSFRTVPFYDVLAGRLPDGFLRGRVVLVGSSLAGLADLKPVPLQAAFPGVEIQATELSNLMAGDPLRAAGRVGLLAMLLVAALPAALAFTWRRSWQGLLLLAAIALLLWLVSLAALQRGLILPVALPAVMGTLAGGVALAQRLLGEEQQRRWLASAFSRYVSQELLAELMRHPERLRLGGERRELSLLFCDIRSFTRISEEVAPGELGGLLNRYLTAMSRVVLEQGGTLDKYIGDAIVAFFGAPVAQTDHARRALRAAREMQRRLEDLRREFAGTPFADLQAGIGVHCGPVLVGNFGSDLRFDYTAIGDAMNLASRLEGLTKTYASPVLVTRDVLDAAGVGFPARLVDVVRVLGKRTPVAVHELLVADGEPDPAWLAGYEEARACYAVGHFSTAARLFHEHLAGFPGDGAARELLGRCEFLVLHHRENWDGVWRLDRK
jgi:adenylate cyclase